MRNQSFEFSPPRVFCLALVFFLAPAGLINSQDAKQEQEELNQDTDLLIQSASIAVDNEIILSTTIEGSTASYGLLSNGAHQLFVRPYFNANQQLLDYMTSPNVQKQIELSSDQKKQFADIRKRMAASMAEVSNRFPQLKDPKTSKEKRKELHKNYTVELKKVREEFNEEVKESLVPQQLKLIQQLRFQSSANILGFSQTISSKPFADEIKTTDKQKKAIQKIKAEAEAEIRKTIEEIRKKAKEKMLKELNRSQRDKIKDLEGKNEKPIKL